MASSHILWIFFSNFWDSVLTKEGAGYTWLSCDFWLSRLSPWFEIYPSTKLYLVTQLFVNGHDLFRFGSLAQVQSQIHSVTLYHPALNWFSSPVWVMLQRLTSLLFHAAGEESCSSRRKSPTATPSQEDQLHGLVDVLSDARPLTERWLIYLTCHQKDSDDSLRQENSVCTWWRQEKVARETWYY